nr:hypothetical protein [Tanacetum cinerariifolium]
RCKHEVTEELTLAWNNIALIMRNKPNIETLNIDDLYNNLKVYEAEIKRESSSGSNSYKVDFVSSENTSSINKTATAAYDIPAVGSKEQPSASIYADDVLFSFFLINSQMSANDKTGLGYYSQLSENEMPKCKIFEIASDSNVSEIDEDNNQAKDRYKLGIRYHAVPPPYTRNYMPPRADLSFAGLDDSVFKLK